uniref:Uncharacterized protein n=1 Tax=Amphimedon queenslandica TaxID=400682 RepID=A0A1X7UT08_AMPQE
MAFLMRRSIPRDVLIQRAVSSAACTRKERLAISTGVSDIRHCRVVSDKEEARSYKFGLSGSFRLCSHLKDSEDVRRREVFQTAGCKASKSDDRGATRDSPGFIVNGGQYVLFIVPWAAHGLAVCSDQSVTVRLHNDRTLTGTVTATDRAADLALVKLHLPKGSKPLPSLEFASRLRPGEWVIAFGLPFAQIAFSPGIVMDVRAHIIDQEYVLTNAAIPTYFHGSVFVNLDGEVIGVNVMEDHSCEYTLGMSFAIPSDFAKKFLKRAMKETSSSSKRKRKGFIMIHT